MKTAKFTHPFQDFAEKIAGQTPGDLRDLPEDLPYESFACTNCGYCRNVCTLFDTKEWESASPRGKFNFLKDYMRGEAEISQDMVDNFLLCTTCKRCNDVCHVEIPIQELWDDIRGFLIEEKDHQTFPAFDMMNASYGEERNIWAEFQRNRDEWLPDEIDVEEKGGKVGYWAGCTASYLEQDIARNAVRILDEGDMDFTHLGSDEGCCRIPFLMSGKWDTWREAVKYNIERIKEKGIEKLVISCPGCYVALSHYYDEWTDRLGLE